MASMLQTTLAGWLKGPQIPVLSQNSLDEPLVPDQAKHENSKLKETCNASSLETSSPQAEEQQLLEPQVHDQHGVTALPLGFELQECSKNHMDGFRRLNKSLLPIPYSEKFYTETVMDPTIASLCRVITWSEAVANTAKNGQVYPDSSRHTEQIDRQERLVAAIRCRLLRDPNTDHPVLYISTIGTLAPFRRYGLASAMLNTVIRTAVHDYGVVAVMAHVWEANEEAIAWYQKRGFKIVSKEEQYYRRLRPKAAAWVVRRDVVPSDLLKETSRVHGARDQL